MREHSRRQRKGLLCRQTPCGCKHLTEDTRVGLSSCEFKNCIGEPSRQLAVTRVVGFEAEPLVLPVSITLFLSMFHSFALLRIN